MKNSIFTLLLLCTTMLYAQNPNNTTAQNSYTPAHAPVKIGDEISTNLQTAHPYNSSNQTGVVFEQEFYNKNSAYIKLYFEDFDLGPKDYVEISTHNTGESIIYAGKGKIIDKEGTMISDFWSRALLDEKITVRLHTQAASTHYGFKISKVAYGYSAERIESIVNGKSICGRDDKERIACYNGTIKATRAKAVCKLIIGGTGSCTGWLLGCEGHVMTNNHCVANARKAANTDFLFNYQYRACTGSGTLSAARVATSAQFIKTSSGLDYTLLKLPTNPTSTYGYLSLSSKRPAVGDRIYIIGHPGGRRKEITVKSDRDANGFAQVNTLNTNGMRYYADTEGGSSGSPVLSNSSNLVYAIHNTGGCQNGSYGRCDKLIAHIGNDMPKSGVDYSPCNGTGNRCYARVGLKLVTDRYASETSWTVKNSSGTTVASGNGYANSTTYNLSWTLPDGNYTFTINDSRNDGICCRYGRGSYSIIGDGTTIATGGSFGRSASVNFCVRTASTACPRNVSLTLVTDRYASETSWEVRTTSGALVRSGSGYSNSSTNNINLNLSPGSYRFTIKDSYGDGICCNYGRGSFTLKGDGRTLGSGSNFKKSATVNFCVGSRSRSNPASAVSSAIESNPDALSTEPFLTVSPNPFNSFLKINTNIEGLANYRLINVQGQTIKEGLLQGNSIELGDINRGVYFLTLYNEKEQLVRKVIKQ